MNFFYVYKCLLTQIVCFYILCKSAGWIKNKFSPWIWPMLLTLCKETINQSILASAYSLAAHNIQRKAKLLFFQWPVTVTNQFMFGVPIIIRRGHCLMLPWCLQRTCGRCHFRAPTMRRSMSSAQLCAASLGSSTSTCPAMPSTASRWASSPHPHTLLENPLCWTLEWLQGIWCVKECDPYTFTYSQLSRSNMANHNL